MNGERCALCESSNVPCTFVVSSLLSLGEAGADSFSHLSKLLRVEDHPKATSNRSNVVSRPWSELRTPRGTAGGGQLRTIIPDFSVASDRYYNPSHQLHHNKSTPLLLPPIPMEYSRADARSTPASLAPRASTVLLPIPLAAAPNRLSAMSQRSVHQPSPVWTPLIASRMSSTS